MDQGFLPLNGKLVRKLCIEPVKSNIFKYSSTL